LYDVHLPEESASLPSWSADGRQVAFSAAVHRQKPTIYLANADGSGLKELFVPPGEVEASVEEILERFGPTTQYVHHELKQGAGTVHQFKGIFDMAWKEDGTGLCFISALDWSLSSATYIETGYLVQSHAVLDGAIHEVNVQDGQVRRLAATIPYGLIRGDLWVQGSGRVAWSPDRNLIAVTYADTGLAETWGDTVLQVFLPDGREAGELVRLKGRKVVAAGHE